jgi:hypothetical protein
VIAASPTQRGEAGHGQSKGGDTGEGRPEIEVLRSVHELDAMPPLRDEDPGERIIHPHRRCLLAVDLGNPSPVEILCDRDDARRTFGVERPPLVLMLDRGDGGRLRARLGAVWGPHVRDNVAVGR